MGHVDPSYFAATLIVIFFAIGLHEYAHCKVADLAGDPTPRFYGRVTLNLFKHFDPLGTVMIIITALSGFGIGWGRPAPMDPRKMSNPRWDFFAAVAAGPVSNVLQAIVWALLLRVLFHGAVPLGPNADFVAILCVLGVLVNLSLCFFNLIPLGPLDGHWLLGQLLPEKQRYGWYRFNATFGYGALLVLVLGSQFFTNGPSLISRIIGPPVLALFKMLTGLDLH